MPPWKNYIAINVRKTKKILAILPKQIGSTTKINWIALKERCSKKIGRRCSTRGTCSQFSEIGERRGITWTNFKLGSLK